MFAITVPASKPGKVYTIRKVTETTWVCDCPDHVYRAHAKDFACKHIAELAASLASFTVAAVKSKSAVEILASASA